MTKSTSLLPPSAGVRIAWALTGKFPKSEQSNLSATYAENALKDIELQAKSSSTETRYVTGAKAMIFSSLRNLDTIYKGRELNFTENEKLRSAYLENIKENLDFGNKAKDFLKSLPTMTIGSAGGVTLASLLGLSGNVLIGLGFVLAASGYLLNVLIVRLMRKRTQTLYLKEDHDRNLYYDQYVTRVAMNLTSLYLDLDRWHHNVFGAAYSDGRQVGEIIEGIMCGLKPTHCIYLQKHMDSKRITPELWPICETGDKESVKQCAHWEEKA
jgi:hypothetical protein